MAIFIAAALWPRGNHLRRRALFVLASTVVFAGVTAWVGKYLFQTPSPEDTVPSMLHELQAGKGYSGMDEYQPIGGDISSIALNLPPACLVNDPRINLGKPNADGNMVWDSTQGTCEATFEAAPGSGPEHQRISGISARSGFLVLRLLRFPAWRIRVNGQDVANPTAREDGLIVVPVSKGPFEVTADWITSRDMIVARWISGLSALLLIYICLYERRLRRRSFIM